MARSIRVLAIPPLPKKLSSAPDDRYLMSTMPPSVDRSWPAATMRPSGSDCTAYTDGHDGWPVKTIPPVPGIPRHRAKLGSSTPDDVYRATANRSPGSQLSNAMAPTMMSPPGPMATLVAPWIPLTAQLKSGWKALSAVAFPPFPNV